ncbi:MAG TPA: hypothetical protein VM938_01265 [Acidimicrobiales bacterium]|nr:hypothetical protein [Acidimicrobiales bacterium]
MATVSAGPSSALFVDAPAGIVYDVDPLLGVDGFRGRRVNGKQTFDGSPGVRFLDADTLQPLPGDDLALPIAPTGSPLVGQVDEVNRLLFLAATSIDGPSIEIVDARKRAHVGSIKSFAPVGHEVVSLAVTPENRLFVIAGVSGERRRLPVIAELDPMAVVRGTGVGVVGRYNLTQPCDGIAAGDAFGASRTAAYVSCNGLDTSNLHRPASFQGVYTISLVDGHLPPQSEQARFFAVPGGFQFGWGLFDAVSERVILMTRDFGPRGAFVFDGKHQAMVGLIGQLGNLSGGCVDVKTGRFYGYTTSHGSNQNMGLLIGEARATPSPQGYGFPEYARDSVSGRVSCDPVRRHVFLKKSGTKGYSYDVVRDDIPVYIPPSPPPDPDTYTSDTPADARGAEVNYQALGRAFGARVTLVGGYSNLALNYVNIELVDTAMTTVPPACPPDDAGLSCSSIKSNVSPSSRDFVFGAVGDPGESASVGVSNFTVGAAANGGDRDAATENDMGRAAKVAERAPSDTPTEVWPFRQLLCSTGPGLGAEAVEGHGATVVCDPDRAEGPLATGTAHGNGALFVPGSEAAAPGGLPFGLKVAEASSEVTSRTDPVLGVVTTARARARSVELRTGGAHIVLENVTSLAETSAKGAVGTAKSRYERSIGRLLVNGAQACGPCIPESVVHFLNSLPQSHVRASLPNYDAEAFTPTRGGYQAAVIRDRWEQLDDAVLNERSNYDLQVPALRLAVQEDAYQHSAILIDLAAPQAEAHLGVKPCAFCGGSGGDGSGGGGGGGGAAPGFAAIGATLPELGGHTTIEGKPVIRYRDRRTPLQQIVDGLKVVFTSPGKLGGVLLVWSVLACPVYLASRRRLVLQRMQDVVA